MEYLIFIFPFKSNCRRLKVPIVLCTGGNLIIVPWCEGSVILFDAKASGKTLWSAADTCFHQTTHHCSAHRTFRSDVSTASGPLTADTCEQIEGPGTLVSCVRPPWTHHSSTSCSSASCLIILVRQALANNVLPPDKCETRQSLISAI